jgi:indolepyruvate ferredoxin oxidoreductase, beta subunit
MKTDIILAGVGGQGILSIAAILGQAVLKENLFLKQAETHGMSQRGGAVVSHLRISERKIAADLIPLGEADIILSVEPMEGLRYLSYLSESGYLVTNSTPFINIPNYPDLDKIMEEIKKQPHYLVIDADKIARETGSRRISNMVMLGTATPFIHIDPIKIEDSIIQFFQKKGNNIVQLNLRAFRTGKKFTMDNI